MPEKHVDDVVARMTPPFEHGQCQFLRVLQGPVACTVTSCSRKAQWNLKVDDVMWCMCTFHANHLGWQEKGATRRVVGKQKGARRG